MKIGGLQKLTLIDYPDKLSAIVFLSGCNFRCPFCYSPELVLPEKIKKHPKVSEKEFFDFLKSKKGLLEGVVVCGGEPCVNKDLPKFLRKIKKLGYFVKLDTNGSNPNMLKKLIKEKLVDYVAMDVKAPPKKYRKITGGKANIKNIEKSISILKKNKIDYEFRTTVVPELTKKDILEIVRWIKGGKRYYLQNFLPEKTLDPKLTKAKPYSEEYLLQLLKMISPFFETYGIR